MRSPWGLPQPCLACLVELLKRKKNKWRYGNNSRHQYWIDQSKVISFSYVIMRDLKASINMFTMKLLWKWEVILIIAGCKIRLHYKGAKSFRLFRPELFSLKRGNKRAYFTECTLWYLLCLAHRNYAPCMSSKRFSGWFILDNKWRIAVMVSVKFTARDRLREPSDHRVTQLWQEYVTSDVA